MKFFCSLLFLIIFSFSHLSAQNLDEPVLNNRVGFKAGLNYSILSAAINNDIQWKTGLAAGIYYQGKIKDNVSIQVEMLFSMLGCKNNYLGFEDEKIGEGDLSLNYLNFPLLFKFYEGQHFNFALGPQLGFLLSAKEKGYVLKHHYDSNSQKHIYGPERETINENQFDIFAGTDFSMIIGMGYDFSFGLNLGLRLNWGVSNIYPAFKQLTGTGLSNRSIQFTVGFSPKLVKSKK